MVSWEGGWNQDMHSKFLFNWCVHFVCVCVCVKFMVWCTRCVYVGWHVFVKLGKWYTFVEEKMCVFMHATQHVNAGIVLCVFPCVILQCSNECTSVWVCSCVPVNAFFFFCQWLLTCVMVQSCVYARTCVALREKIKTFVEWWVLLHLCWKKIRDNLNCGYASLFVARLKWGRDWSDTAWNKMF